MSRNKCFRCGLINSNADRLCRRCGVNLGSPENAPPQSATGPVLEPRKPTNRPSRIVGIAVAMLSTALLYNYRMHSSEPPRPKPPTESEIRLNEKKESERRQQERDRETLDKLK
ncbi:MAG: hypothetical protein JSS81_23435 [Acidobacteria bacterium]|nr:hypothetical protein [Acidobacteriota bacterium]